MGAVQEYVDKLKAGDTQKKLEVSSTRGKCFVQELQAAIRAAFDGREADICSTWAWAADALSAQRVFTEDAIDPAEQDETLYDARKNAVQEAVAIWYDGDKKKQAAAMTEYETFVARSGRFSPNNMDIDSAFPKGKELENQTTFWNNKPSSLLADLAVRLAHGVAGQGSAERMNKFVANTLTKARNQQTQIVTEALVTIKYDVFNEKRKRRKVNGRARRNSLTFSNDENDEDEGDEARDDEHEKLTVTRNSVVALTFATASGEIARRRLFASKATAT